MARPLLVTTDPSLLDDVLRLAAAAGVELEVAADPSAVRRSWRTAPVVLVGADRVDAAVAAGFARRDGVLLVSSDWDDATVWRRALEVGAEHVTLLPEAEAWLVERLRSAGRGGAPARVIGVVGGRGGAGATTLAVALAFAGLARGRRTLLVDADPHGGGIDLAVGGERTAGARIGDAPVTGDLAEALPRMDGLTVLAWDRKEPPRIPPARLVALLAAARQGSEVVVVDLPRTFDESACAALAAVGTLLLVVPAEVRACAAAARVAESASAYVEDVRLVVRGPAPSGLTAEQVASTVGLPLAGWLRPEPGLAAALERGDPPGRRRGPLARFCAALLDELEAA